ncbi:hypothetical protein MHY87_01300 [Microvirga sp. ACRRW]|uniref:hypothetical protein n=1 Tax=Microvirga sp. ACRRW TaxID=2918205 RepID=UPI001EF42AE2|nr:hypothetical protein [Microvirga sp. ACRRW]MCG7391544.1 hypothetical protein [Microvirga sp. ACRRW]
MSVERANVAVEHMIADHVAVSFKQKASPAGAESTAAQIRQCITDKFELVAPGNEQDNSPPAIQLLRDSLIKAFSPAQAPNTSQSRAEQLALLHSSLEGMRRISAVATLKPGKPVHVDLLLERQQLVLKNEFTEGFGRFETWLISIAALALVLLNAIDYLWAIPILALSVGRSWHLDRQCKKRRERIAEIDAVVQPAARTSHS